MKNTSKKGAKVIRNDRKFRKKILAERFNVCAECAKNGYDDEVPEHVLIICHIWGKGSAGNAFRHDPRNVVLLCDHHHKIMDGHISGVLKIENEIEEQKQLLYNEYYKNK